MKKIVLFSLLTLSVPAVAEEAALDSMEVVELSEVVINDVKGGNTRKQPSAVTLIDKVMMDNNHLASLKGASNLVPNMFIPDYGSRLTSAIYIRGIGSRINNPTVGLYVDNMPYFDKSAFDFNLYDIERIDVLRGPQGTLYGRNAMGGIVNIYTKNPMYYQGTEVKLGFATRDNHRDVSLTHYHRVSNNIAFSAGGYYEGGDGFYKNDVTGKNADGMLSAGGRVRGFYDNHDGLTIDLIANYDYSDEKAYPYFYTGSLTGTEEYHDYIGRITNNRDNTYRRNLFNVGVNVGYIFPNWLRLNAITSYQHLSDRMFMDQDFIQPDIYTLEQRQLSNCINEEITLKKDDGLWQWITGVNMMHQGLTTNGPVTFYEDGVSSIIEENTNSVFEALRKQNPKMPEMYLEMTDREFVVTSDMKTPVTTMAMFHQSSLHLGRFILTGGLRLEYEKLHLDYASESDVSFDFNIKMPAPIPSQSFPGIKAQPKLTGTLDNNDLQILPKLSLMYQLDGNVENIYVTASKGYRSGGYNIQMFSDIIQNLMRSEMISGINTEGEGVVEKMLGQDKYEAMMVNADVNSVVYKPEYSWNFELGSKLYFPEACLRVDAALFYNHVYDQQLSRFAPSGLGRMMVNAGKSQSYGGELSAMWKNNGTTINGNYGFTHAEFTEYEDGKNDYAGKHVPFVPMHTVSLDANHEWRVKGGILGNNSSVVSVGANISGAGRIYWTENNEVSEPFYALLGARIGYTCGNYGVILWGKNLTRKKYNTFYFESASRCFEQHGKPLQVGIDINIKL